ncbi:2-isopropylmalate synthase [Pantoea agglomerans]|uniref:2-isopropylmalate synthase n=1 Tax=Enterobacter agglomerans TaxID=549 RepID=A0A379AME9_ENTAG|nr:2-isopropylmalate synthase [Pantoea agglomerans]
MAWGERAGNCALEEVIMAIKTRQQIMNVHTNINHQEIYRTSPDGQPDLQHADPGEQGSGRL